jgi:hypothetical protein
MSHYDNPIAYLDANGKNPVLFYLAYLALAATLYDIGEGMHETDLAMQAKAKGDMQGYTQYMAKSGEYGLGLAFDVAGGAVFKGLGMLYKASKPVIKVATSQLIDASKWTANSLGDLGEFALSNYYKGAQQVRKMTTSGSLRIIDVLDGTIARESKVGFKRGSDKFIQEQFSKDLELLADAESGVTEVVWTFFKSPKTGKVGADGTLQGMFKAAQEAGYNIRSEILDVTEEAFEKVAAKYTTLIE